MAGWRPWTRAGTSELQHQRPKLLGHAAFLYLGLWMQSFHQRCFDDIDSHTDLTWKTSGRVLGQEDCSRFVWSVTAPVWQTTLLCWQGRQFPDANLPGVPPEQTKAIFEASIRTLVQLQSVDTDKLDLDGIGDKENFFHQKVSTQHTRLRAISFKTASLDNAIQVFSLA